MTTRGRAVVMTLIGSALLGGAAPAAATAATTSAAIYSDPGDFVGGGQQLVVHPGNVARFDVRTTDDGIEIAIAGGSPVAGYTLEFAAPRGQALEPRNYVQVQRRAFRDPGFAGMDVAASSRGCNKLNGRFEVRQLEYDAAGRVSRLWIVFQQHCEYRFAAAYGEIRFNATVPEEQTGVAPGVVRWAPLDTWRSVGSVPVTYLGSAAVASVALAGPGAQDHAIVTNACAGRPGPCDVVVSYAPRATGASAASLRITDAAGGVHVVSLEGFEHGGETSAVLEVLAGDVAGKPGTYRFAPADANFSADVGEHYANQVLESKDRTKLWTARFINAPSALGLGDYSALSSDETGGPTLDVYGREAGCDNRGGEFGIRELTRLPDGELRTLATDFLQRCYDDRRPSLRGVWKYRAGDTAPLPAWMQPGPRERIAAPVGDAPAAPLGGSTTSGSAGGAGATSGDAGTPATAGTGPGTHAAPDGQGALRRRAQKAGCPAALVSAGRARAGGPAADRLRGSSIVDLLLGAGGADVLTGLGGRDCLVGEDGRDRLDGGPGDDRLLGGAGDDHLSGGTGNDVLVGGPGRDVLACGPGRRDRAIAGPGDRTSGCETVRRTVS